MCKIKNLLLAAIFVFLSSNIASAEVNEALISKVSFGRAEDVTLLLQQKANPNIRSRAGFPVILIAAARSDEEAPKIVKALIDGGADFYSSDANGNVPIVEAVRRGRPETVKILVENKAIMSVHDIRGNDLTKLAAIRGDKQIIAYVKAGTEAEQKKLSELKSSQNLTKQVQKYAMLVCSNYYLTYFKKDNPDKISDEKYTELTTRNKKETADMHEQMSTLFDMGEADFKRIISQTKKQARDKLDSLLTNENRLYNGFGSNSHLNKVCKDIAQKWDGSRISYIMKGDDKIIISPNE